jgi:hypothetical protein
MQFDVQSILARMAKWRFWPTPWPGTIPTLPDEVLAKTPGKPALTIALGISSRYRKVAFYACRGFFSDSSEDIS